MIHKLVNTFRANSLQFARKNPWSVCIFVTSTDIFIFHLTTSVLPVEACKVLLQSCLVNVHFPPCFSMVIHFIVTP